MNKVVSVSQTDGIKYCELSEEMQHNLGLVYVLAKLLWHSLCLLSARGRERLEDLLPTVRSPSLKGLVNTTCRI